MAEIEIIKRAKTYFDKMAQGINPLTDSPVSPDDLIRNESISFCLAYVSLLLNQIIEKEEIYASELPLEKAAATLETIADKLAAFEFSERPISINDLVQRIQALNLGKKITSQLVTKWLVELSMLIKNENSDNISKSYFPTESGKSIGMMAVANEERKYVLLDNEAQHFIVDNIPSILAFYNATKENQGKPWLPEDDAKLKELYLKDTNIQEIAAEFRRSTGAIRSRLRHLGLVQ